MPVARNLLFVALCISVAASVSCRSADPPPVPQVAIGSPSDGATIVGSRSIAVTGTVSDATTVVVQVVGGATVDATVDGGAFSAVVELGDRANGIVATATGDGGSASDRVDVVYPFVGLTSNQEAELVIGTTAFTAYGSGVASPAAFAGPYGRSYFDGERLFVPDLQGNQALVFDLLPDESGAAADWFLGSTDGLGGAGTRTAGDLRGPESVFVHDGRLFVVERANSRIQVFDPVPTASGAAGTFVIGKDDFDDDDLSCVAGRFNQPSDAHVGGGRMVVSDTLHHRVLVYLEVPTAAGALPDLVLGQTDMVSCGWNRDGTPGAGTLASPGGVWTDGERVVVADSENHRVLLWSTFPTADGQPADLVLGQETFGEAVSGAGPGGLAYPRYVDANGNQLVVADWMNSRVLVWNEWPTHDAAPADVVLGQEGLDDALYLAPDAEPTARNFAIATGVSLGPDFVLTLDAGVGRALLFRAQP